MIIYLGNKATERDTLDFLTNMLSDGYIFRGITMGYAKLKYTGHHDRSSKISVMSKEDYDKLSEVEKKTFQYIDETGGNVFYKTKKSIGDNNFYRNKKEEKERNPSNYIVGGLVGIAALLIIIKIVTSIDTQSIWVTLGKIFLHPLVLLMVLLPGLLWFGAWIVHKVRIRGFEAEDSRESRKKARKAKLQYNTVMQFASLLIQLGIAATPLVS